MFRMAKTISLDASPMVFRILKVKSFVAFGWGNFFDKRHVGPQIGFGSGNLFYPKTFLSLQDDGCSVIRHFKNLYDFGDRSNAIQIF